MGELSERDKAILNLERRYWRTVARKEAAVRTALNLSPNAYYQTLNALISTEAATAYAPMVVARLRIFRER